MRKVLAIVGIAVLVVLVLAIAGTALVVSHFAGAPTMMRGFGVRGFVPGVFGFGWLLLLLRILVWGLVIAGIAFLAVRLFGARQPAMTGPTREAPLDILKVRLAKGEITKEQYDQLKHDLEG